MKVPFNDLSFQNNQIRKELEDCFRQSLEDSYYVRGPAVTEFENAFAEYLGADFCIGTGNCTDSLEIILEAMDIGEGDEVIVPAYTWVSSASCVARVGARPVFVDVDPNFYTLDPNLIEASISNRTKAIVVVHFYGLSADMDSINEIAKKYDLRVVEDCAQATGAVYKNKKAGTLGDAAAFSFYPTKTLGALGDGGAIVTNDPELERKARQLANHGQAGKHKHRIIGRNSRLDSLQATILKLKLEHLDDWNRARISAAGRYSQKLKGNIIKLPYACPNAKHVYHLYVIQIEGNYLVQEFLEKRGIESSIHYPMPVPEIETFEKYKQYGDCYTVSKRMACRILSLPMFYGISNDQIDHVSDSLKDAIAFFG